MRRTHHPAIKSVRSTGFRVQHRDGVTGRWVDSGRCFASEAEAMAFIASLDQDGFADLKNNRIKAEGDA